jgi:hypothetical protein
MQRDKFISVDEVWVKAIVDEHLKGLSPSQRVEAFQYLRVNLDKLYQGLDEGLRLCLDDWHKKKNAGDL